MATTDDVQQFWKPGRWWRVIHSAPSLAQGLWCETSSANEALALYHRLDDPSKKLQRQYESTEGWLVERRWHTVLEDTGVGVVFDDEPEYDYDGLTREWFRDTLGTPIGVMPCADDALVSVVVEDGASLQTAVHLTPEEALRMARAIAQSALDQVAPPPTPPTSGDPRGWREQR